MKKLIVVIFSVLLGAVSSAQNIGIGVANPTRAKLEVWGAAGTGTTVGLIGDARAVSLHRNYAGVGLNMYRDQNNVGRYLLSGYAALWQYVHDDPTLVQGLDLYMYPSGADNAVLPAGVRAWHFTSNYRLWIREPVIPQFEGSAAIDVGRGNGPDGTAVFQGTQFNSHINYSTAENTYIRGGKASSNVILNDIPDGKVVLGGGAATVGLNTNFYVPPTTLEVRQYNGGMELSTTSYPALAWEWRVANGSPAHFYLYYAGALRAYFSYTDGSLHTASDARLKDNIVSLPPVLDRLMQLRAATYKMKDAATGQQRSMGFIAQQVKLLFPLLSCDSMPGGEDLLGVNYSGFGVIAIKGIQEEQTIIDNMEKDLSDIDKRLKALETLIFKR